MKKIYYLSILCLLSILFGCKTAKIADIYGAYNPHGAYIMHRDTFTIVQVDSMTNADKLPVLTKWASSVMKDAETQVNYNYYTLLDKNTNIIYTVKVVNNSYIVIKKKINN